MYMKRRDFLKVSAFGAAAAAASPLRLDAGEKPLTVQKYRPLGKTGLTMSDISFGTGRLPSASMVLRAVDRGINYFDTAPDYGLAEKYLGEAMKKLKRDKIIIASKFCNPLPYPAHLPLGTKKDEYIKAVEGSLTRMNTDYLDVCFVHAIGENKNDQGQEMKRLLDEEMFSAAEALKKAGKIRFLAVSSHGPNNLDELLSAAIKSGRFDVVQMAFNFMKFPKEPEILKLAAAHGLGVIAMKTLAGAKDMAFDAKGEPFEPAALKWALKHPELSGLIITIKSIDDLDLYLQASGKDFTASDRRVLDLYARRFGSEYCRTGCGECEPLCPNGVDIASTLRYQMYFKDYGSEKLAMTSYAALDNKAAACADCGLTGCTAACPFGLNVKGMLIEAHNTLSFNV
jgi:hypothetical protein